MVYTTKTPAAPAYSVTQSALPLRAIELFAGVGGFRLGLEKAGWSVVWSNQWEPSTKIQHASCCYTAHFGEEGHTNEDIAQVLDKVESGEVDLPNHDLLVGGFPCQDYSVARTLNQAAGLIGKKGVLWWEIYRLLRMRQPRFVLLENVDRLLKSPATQRGRDFAVMLACLAEVGYTVEWRVVNAADYGFPQRRRRVFIFGERNVERIREPQEFIADRGLLAKALPSQPGIMPLDTFTLPRKLDEVSLNFSVKPGIMPFKNSGIMQNRTVWTTNIQPHHIGPKQILRDVLQDEKDIPLAFFIPDDDVQIWQHLKGAKAEPRVTREGYEYQWAEGAVAFPDSLDKPSRTILTAEGGSSPSRFKHVIETTSGRLRRLTPIELERLNGFPNDWTDGITDTRRAFLMGNALVVGVVEAIARVLANRASIAQTQPSRLFDPVVVYSRAR